MDEWTFQHELYKLKERVANMTARHLPSSPQSQPSSLKSGGLEFTVQVDDLKQHIARLEQVLGIAHSCTPQPSQPYAMPRDRSPLAQTAPIPQSGNDSPRSRGHSFLPLYHGLRCEIDGISSRFLDVERTVFELEDKMERFDPDRFTPLGSEASTDDGVGLHPALHETPAPPSLPYSAYVQDTRGIECRNGSATSSATPNAGSASPSTTKQVAEGLLRAKLDASHVTLDILRKFSARMDSIQPLKKKEQSVVCAIVKLHRRLAADHSWNAPSLKDDSQTEELHEASGSRRTSVAASELDAPESFQPRSEELPAPSPSHVQAAGVAFRDQEISRLEELLSEAQEAATLGEQQACHDRQASDALHERYEFCAKENDYLRDIHLQRDAEVCKLREEAAQREVHLQQLNDYLHTRDEQRERYSESYRQVLERSREKSAIIHSAECRVEKLQQMLQECQRNKDNDIDQIMQGREEEVGRLQQFCEQKDAIAHSQEEIIVRGARLMEQRDEEIEALTRKVRALQGDNASEKKHRQLMSKLLEERDAELRGQSLASRAQWVTDDIRRNRHGGTVVDADEGDERPTPTPRSVEVQNDLGSHAAAEHHPANRKNMAGRHSLPVDCTVWPPLPAPVAANRMQSLADLRSAARSEQLQRVVRHKSMQELGKRKEHQAYVETEVEESGGEFGGEAA
ncbi:hypothetical protein B0A55_02424 [Friedmanniomyces simplex]|uniref:Uncharacterized protein n=1 Tax=Friedmanniomyces simplex TaxID=329884 RepID=A0A4U0XNY3_9PEZI|nr:hypothetical protein B0A55_02424 [Friedmanniomyces simplex]